MHSRDRYVRVALGEVRNAGRLGRRAVLAAAGLVAALAADGEVLVYGIYIGEIITCE